MYILSSGINHCSKATCNIILQHKNTAGLVYPQGEKKKHDAKSKRCFVVFNGENINVKT